MATVKHDIEINVDAQYQTLDILSQKIEQVKTAFGSFTRGRTSQKFAKIWTDVPDQAEAMAKALDIAFKQIEKNQDNLTKAMVLGKDSAIQMAQAQLAESKRNIKDLAKAIVYSQEYKKLNEEIRDQYQDMVNENFGSLMAEQSAKYDAEEIARKDELLRKQEEVAQQIREQQTQMQNFFAGSILLKQYDEAQTALQKVMLALDPVKEKMTELRAQMSGLQEEFIQLNMSGQDTRQTENSIKRVYKQMQKLEETAKGSANGISILWNRIKNISIYRAIRSLIRSITSGFKEGLNNFVQYSDSANKTVSNLNASLKQIRNTMGIALAQTLIALEPVITRIADALVDLINSFNLAMAKMQGKDVYSKAKKNVDDYAKSLEKVQKLSFDAFESLSGNNGTSPAEMFEDASVFGDENALSKTFEIVLKLGKAFENILEALGGIKTVVITLIGMGIGKLVTKFIGSLGSIKLGLLNAKVGLQEWNLQCGLAKSKIEILQMSWKTLTVAILSSVVAIVSIVKNWDSMSKQTKGWVIAIASITGAVAALSFAILAATGQWAKAFTVAGGIVTTGATVLTAISGFENGGIPDKSELFYMNENGTPEALVNTGGSQTNVINIDQLSEGMRRGFVQAIYDTGLLTAMQQGSSTIVVDKDVLGRTVAESAGFRNEVNRRNVSLNLK